MHLALFSLSVAVFAALMGLGWTLDAALYRAATVLVAASPCAVVISVPAAILSALLAAARGGVLFKGGAALEMLAEVQSFAFDKTGTLTTGQAEVTGLVTLDGSEAEMLALLAGIEAQSEHHFAGAVLRHALAHRLSRRTAAVIKQNLAFSIGAMGVLVVAGLFFDLPLPLAVVGHEGGTLLVVLNGLRLLGDPVRTV